MSLDTDDIAFLFHIKKYCKERPHIAPHVAQYASAGVEERMEEMQDDASNLEAALAASLMPKFNGPDAFILEKLEDIVARKRNRFRWDWAIEMLREKVGKIVGEEDR